MTPPDKNKAGSPPEPPTLERTLEPATSGGSIVGAVSVSRTTITFSPIPDVATLEAYERLIPGSAQRILENGLSQSSHRRELEKEEIAHKHKLADRGQLIGAMIGMTGVIGGIAVAILATSATGQIVGSVLSGGTLLSLVSLFVLGRGKEKEERIEKEKIRQQIRENSPVKDIVQPDVNG